MAGANGGNLPQVVPPRRPLAHNWRQDPGPEMWAWCFLPGLCGRPATRPWFEATLLALRAPGPLPQGPFG